MYNCGVISEIDIKIAIRLGLPITAGFIEAIEIKGFLLI
jgi:hypothetical protein